MVGFKPPVIKRAVPKVCPVTQTLGMGNHPDLVFPRPIWHLQPMEGPWKNIQGPLELFSPSPGRGPGIASFP